MEGLLPTGTGKLLLHVIIIGVWLALLLLLWRWIAKRTANKNNESTATLTRVIALWLGFLAMPLWPGETGLRLALYIPLGAVVLLILVDSLFPKKTIYRYVAATVTLTFSVMSGAEAVSLAIVYADKTRTSQELAAVADKYGLSQNDLVITPYSAGPIANWFLGTKASLVTAAEYNSATQYDRIFVLNTLERPAPGLEPGECRLMQSDNDRYWATRHDVPLGEDAIPDPDYNKFAFYRLKSLPEDWKFDGEGRWTGWGDCF